MLSDLQEENTVNVEESFMTRIGLPFCKSVVVKVFLPE
jgi:hypothetical protein